MSRLRQRYAIELAPKRRRTRVAPRSNPSSNDVRLTASALNRASTNSSAGAASGRFGATNSAPRVTGIGRITAASAAGYPSNHPEEDPWWLFLRLLRRIGCSLEAFSESLVANGQQTQLVSSVRKLHLGSEARASYKAASCWRSSIASEVWKAPDAISVRTSPANFR